MKTASLIKSAATGAVSLSGRLKILLMVIAFIITAGTLWYTHDLVDALSRKEKDVADLYAKSFEYIANGKAGDGDYNFLFTEIINTIDFPVIMTDRHNEPEIPYLDNIKNISLNTVLPLEEQHRYLRNLIAEMDRSHPENGAPPHAGGWDQIRADPRRCAQFRMGDDALQERGADQLPLGAQGEPLGLRLRGLRLGDRARVCKAARRTRGHQALREAARLVPDRHAIGQLQPRLGHPQG